MGGKIEQDFQVEHWRKGVSGFDVMATAGNISVARTAFWAAVDARAASLFAGDQILLRHGARVILTYPPEAAKAAAAAASST